MEEKIDRIRQAYAPEQVHTLLHSLAAHAGRLHHALIQKCRETGIPYPEWPAVEQLRIELGAPRQVTIVSQARYPCGLAICCSEPYTWSTVLEVARDGPICELKDIQTLMINLCYRLEALDEIIAFVQAYTEWLVEQIESVQRQFEEYCARRLQSPEHQRYLELLHRACKIAPFEEG